MNSEEPLPAAAGLSDEDILELLKLIRTETDEKILSISSEHIHAEVCTGFMANGVCGDGHSFKCIRTEHGWKIKESSCWIA